MKKSVEDKIFGGLTGKQRLWLNSFFDEFNPLTFMNKSGAAREAGYSEKSASSIGWQNYRKLQHRIEIWLDEYGLSENRLKLKLISLIDAKKHHFQKIKGQVRMEDLPDGVLIVGQSHVQKWAPMDGDVDFDDRDMDGDAVDFDDGDTVIAIPVEALETQRRSLDMAMKVKGLYGADNKQKGEAAAEALANMPPVFNSVEEWEAWKNRPKNGTKKDNPGG